jgi:predicted transglutaminase-like cysteine proteinase
MRNISRWVTAIAALFIASAPQGAKADMVGMPRAALAPMIQHIAFDTPTLAPMAYTMFCLRYADQCKPQRMMFRGGPVRMTAERWNDLKEVNNLVNAAIVPEHNFGGLAAEKWLIGPSSGDCNDYAVTKRSELLDRGWPARALLLSEVVTGWGEHHLVLVVRTRSGDLVVCTENLNPDVVVMKSAKDGERFDASSPLNRAEDRRILVKGSMSSDAVVIVCIGSQDSAQMRLA